MALHDRYARRTPFELAFPDRERARRLADEVHAEAEARGVNPRHPQMFATLGSVAGYLAELQDPEAPAEAVQQYAALTFHSVAFVRAAHPVYLLSTDAARSLVSDVPSGSPEPPEDAGYLQLPQHLFWVDGSPDGVVPESLDGLFWTCTGQGTLHVLLVTGVRPDRPGVGVISMPEAPLEDAVDWLRAQVRGAGEGADFASSIPGSDIDALYGVRAAGEPLKLLARFFALLEGEPGRAERRGAAGAGEAEPRVEQGPTPSDMPYTFIRE